MKCRAHFGMWRQRNEGPPWELDDGCAIDDPAGRRMPLTNGRNGNTFCKLLSQSSDGTSHREVLHLQVDWDICEHIDVLYVEGVMPFWPSGKTLFVKEQLGLRSQQDTSYGSEHACWVSGARTDRDVVRVEYRLVNRRIKENINESGARRDASESRP